VSRDRERGYREAMARHGLADQVHVVTGGLTDAEGYVAAEQALTSAPTALFAANDLAAVGAVAALQESGLRVPEDVSVVGYDGIAVGSLRSVGLTSVAQPLAHMGELAARRLFERIDRPRARTQHLTVEARLAVRGTTGPVRPGG
jgi:DNA-binding LacI/PurR family transcriptional regulator